MFFKSCGGGSRTHDLRVMSPLSYHCSTPQYLVGIDGLEPSTFSVSARCSNQLSYIPIWGDRGESNPRPSEPQSDALTN